VFDAQAGFLLRSSGAGKHLSEILFQQGFELLNDTPKKRVIGKIVRAMGVTAEQVESAFQQVRAQKATNTS